MKTTQAPACLLIAVLLGACAVHIVETAVPPPATPAPTLPPATATAAATPTPRPALTPTTAVALLCPPASAEGGWECREYRDGGGRLRARACAPAPLSEAEWLCYEDLDYGFALEYPARLKASISYNVVSPRDPAGKVRSHEFADIPGGFYLDIWLASEPDLTAWLEKMNRISVGSSYRVMRPNATVGGRPAVVYVEDPEDAPSTLTAFFKDGAHVYRLWRWNACYYGEVPPTDGLPIVRRVLDSIRFSPEPVPAEVPDDIWQQAARSCTSKVGTGQ